MPGMTASADDTTLSEPVQLRGLLLIPVSSIPGVAMEVARGASVYVPPGTWASGAFTLVGEDVVLYEDAGLRYVDAPGALAIRSADGENAVAGPGRYVVSRPPGAAWVDEPRARAVTIEGGRLVVTLVDGRELAVPLALFPRLDGASREDLGEYVLLGGGRGIRWSQLNEDISVAGLLAGFAHDRSKTIGA